MAAGTLTVELSVIEDYGYVCVFLRVINKLSFPRSCAGPEQPKRSWPYRYLVHSLWHQWY